MDTRLHTGTDTDVPPPAHTTHATGIDVLLLHITVLAPTGKDPDAHLHTGIALGAPYRDELVTGTRNTTMIAQVAAYDLLPPLGHTAALAPLQVSLKASLPMTIIPKEEIAHPSPRTKAHRMSLIRPLTLTIPVMTLPAKNHASLMITKHSSSLTLDSTSM